MKLSIIIPIYNVEAYLPACLDSVLNPDMQDYEIIAVNDGSTDSSGRIARDYAARFPERIRLIEQANGGLGCARNTGIRAAEGEYLLFLDSDDNLAPGALPEIMPALETGCDVIFFDFTTVDETGRVLSETSGSGGTGVFTLLDYPKQLLDPPNAWNKLWRRSLFTESGIRFPDRMWYEDLATSPKLYLRARSMTHVARPWIRYLQRGGSITRSKNPERNLEIIQAVDACLDDYRSNGAYTRFRLELEYMALYHQLLTASVRVSRIDPRSHAGDVLLEDFLGKFPDFRQNPYLITMPQKHRLLLSLILRRQRRAVAGIMDLSDRLRR